MSTPQLQFEREKWTEEVKFRQRELDVKEKEAETKAKEQERQTEEFRHTQQEAWRNRWTNPLVVAVFAAAAAATGSAVVALVNGNAQREVEQIKADQALILEAIKANNNPDKAAENLRFFAETALISNPNRRAEITTFLNKRKPGEGPALPSTISPPPRVPNFHEIVEQNRDSIMILSEEFTNPADGKPQKKIGTCVIINNEGYALTSAHLFPSEGIAKGSVSLFPGGDLTVPIELISIDRIFPHQDSPKT